jgi:hypothetical protein
MIPLSKELNISYFGTPVGEEFYRSCLKIDEIHDSFYHFSCLKKSGIIILFMQFYIKLTNFYILYQLKMKLLNKLHFKKI